VEGWVQEEKKEKKKEFSTIDPAEIFVSGAIVHLGLRFLERDL